ncbi:hypothetical protein A167_01614 [Alcanivorax sp. S71-1-4]|uniref:hypothetical protein n=1 Tax=Alcanivorax sp. S71-1-4 TaxID=1177159 RepID=UPI00135CD8CA|nr:hypothetical protein [Alcanivorax sp. S71-1-4]KAF0809543.1 hypothetical protein A167_01614 [Alcanivorax sp. S71-1-4]
MPKYYVAFIDRPRHHMVIPMKAMLNPYNQQAAFCAGMPQFFGGTDDHNQPPAQVLEMEVMQESRGTLELTSGSPRNFYTEGNMFFYYALESQWTATGTPWGAASNPEQQEMDRLVTIDLSRFASDMTDAAIITELARQSGSNLGTPGGTQFQQSATRQAFIRLIRGFLAGTL